MNCCPIAFNCMCQNVKTCWCRNLRRNSKRKLRVNNCNFRIHSRVIHRVFKIFFNVCQNGNICNLACSSRRGCNRNHRNCLIFINRFTLAVIWANFAVTLCNGASRFAAIHRWASAESYRKIGINFTHNFNARINIVSSGICPNIAENLFDFSPAHFYKFVGYAVFCKTLSANKHAVFATENVNIFFNFFPFSVAENKLYRKHKFPFHIVITFQKNFWFICKINYTTFFFELQQKPRKAHK